MVNIFKSLGFLALMFVAVTSVSASQSGTVSSGWLSPAIGGITGHSGYVWVLGSGSLGNAQSGVTYNNWVTTWADKRFQGSIDDPNATWIIDAAFHSDINAKIIVSRQRSTGGNVRAETTCTAEVRGDFSAFTEMQTAVDNISSSSQSTYAAVGGGSTPITYPTGGYLDHKYIPTAWSGSQDNPLTVNCYCSQAYTGSILVFYMYARGKQYIHNNGEQNASLSTTIFHTNPATPGWNGTLLVFDSFGFPVGSWTLP